MEMLGVLVAALWIVVAMALLGEYIKVRSLLTFLVLAPLLLVGHPAVSASPETSIAAGWVGGASC